MQPSISFHHISKRYELGGFHGSLRETITDLFQGMVGKSHQSGKPILWALKDVSFEIHPGEAVGLIGPNGAGKTTALKVATQVTVPTEGNFEVHGRMSALIELGAGFHPDLSGKENIYLNGAILGMKRQEIDQRFDEIVAFSELEEFLDTPVKRYSSGMYARLGFSVAAHVKPEILIVDEVLAVGDQAFQARCLARMAEMKKSGTTIIIVTHAIPRLRRLCDRAILLYHGQIVADGSAEDVIATYSNEPKYSSNLKTQPTRRSNPVEERLSQSHDSQAKIVDVKFFDEDENTEDEFISVDKFTARIYYQTKQPIQKPIFEIWIHSLDGTVIATHTTNWDKYKCDSIEGEGYIDFVVDQLPLMPGKYFFSVALTASDGLTRYDWHNRRYIFGIKSNRFANGQIFLPHYWRAGRN